jgi:isoleucyl-tRNA synthetase
VEVAGVPLTAADFVVHYRAADGWAGVSDKGTEVTVDTRLTPQLRAEGMARNVIRLVQQARKDAGLDVADSIDLHLATTDAELAAAIDTHWATIAGEVQATARLDAPPDGGYRAEVKVDGRPLAVALRKV